MARPRSEAPRIDQLLDCLRSSDASDLACIDARISECERMLETLRALRSVVDQAITNDFASVRLTGLQQELAETSVQLAPGGLGGLEVDDEEPDEEADDDLDDESDEEEDADEGVEPEAPSGPEPVRRAPEKYKPPSMADRIAELLDRRGALSVSQIARFLAASEQAVKISLGHSRDRFFKDVDDKWMLRE